VNGNPPSVPVPPPAVSPRQLIVTGLWLGFLTGFAEVLALGLRLYVIGEFVTLSRHAAWMAPLVDGLLFALIATCLVVLRRLAPTLVTVPGAVGLLVFLAVVALLLPFRQIHLAATFLVAAGIGVQVARLVRSREAGLVRLARRGATGFAVLTLVIAAGLAIRAKLADRSVTRLDPARAGAPSILLIILDTVRARNLGFYGYSRPTTPVLDRWAQGGMVFDRVIATAPWTLPSHASMFTGLYPTELATNWNTPLEKGPATLAEVLGGRGYATAGFVANYRYTGWETGLARGFAHYEDYPVTLGEMFRSAALTWGGHKTLAGPLGLPPLRPRVDARDINHRFLRWLDNADLGRPFFVFLNYLDAHDPYDPSPGFQRAFAPGPRAPRPRDGERVTEAGAQGELKLYDAAIAYLDSAVGALLHELERRGTLANTLVVLTSDHGEEFAEHEIMGHAASLYRPSVEIPLVIALPGTVPAGRVARPVTLRNLAATILDLSGNSDPRIPGHTLRAHWEDPAAAGDRDTLLSHIRTLINQPEWWPASQGDMLSLVRGKYRYIRNLGSGQEELFDFEADVEERRDLAGTPEGRRELPAFRSALQAFTRSAPRH
jgi:arylsulfatase A-like enzyme